MGTTVNLEKVNEIKMGICLEKIFLEMSPSRK